MATTEGAQQRPSNVQEVLTSSQRESIVVDAPANKPEADAKADKPDYVKTIDKMGNELGELRKQNRDLMAKLDTMQIPQREEAAPVSFEEQPEQFIQQSIQQALASQLGPQLQVLQSDLLERKSASFDKKLSESYPDWKETAKGDDFADWVKASPARVQMYKLADANFDVDSATELLKRFRQDQAEAKTNEQGALNAAGLVSGGGETGGARVYAASEIKKMINDDPDRYRQWLAGDGMRAYQEGRVDQNA